jgi:hypothetical protein
MVTPIVLHKKSSHITPNKRKFLATNAATSNTTAGCARVSSRVFKRRIICLPPLRPQVDDKDSPCNFLEPENRTRGKKKGKKKILSSFFLKKISACRSHKGGLDS